MLLPGIDKCLYYTDIRIKMLVRFRHDSGLLKVRCT
jgi:hypothetical protein